MEKRREEVSLTEKKLHPAAKAVVRRAKCVRSKVVIALFTFACFAALIFSIGNFFGGRYIYAALYLIGAVLAAMFTTIRINTVFPPFVAADGENVYMQTWKNRAAACLVNSPVPFLREFLPAKVVRDTIPIANITRVLIGTKNYLKRQCTGDEPFLEAIRRLEQSRVFRTTNSFAAIELLYILCGDGSSYFMSVQDFDIEELVRVLNQIERVSGEVDITCNDVNIRRMRLRIPLEK